MKSRNFLLQRMLCVILVNSLKKYNSGEAVELGNSKDSLMLAYPSPPDYGMSLDQVSSDKVVATWQPRGGKVVVLPTQAFH